MSKPEPGQRISLKDVAQRAGVSIGTVSNVFSGKVWVAPETRSLVLATAAEIGYAPRARAENGPATEKATTFGFIIRDTPIPLGTNPYYGPILRGVERACAAQDLSLMYSVADEHIGQWNDLPMMIQRREIQGLLVVDYLDPVFFTLLQEAAIPFVLLEHKLDVVQADSVTIDDEQGGYLATRYLLDMGHRSPPPAIIAASTHMLSVANRLHGYHRALQEQGLRVLDSYIRTGDLNMGGGYREMNALLDLPIPPTAVFCCNDITAMGAINALKERNISVPDQCSIIGYDDIAMAAQLTPPLTTIRSETELLGMQGVWHLIERLKFPQLSPRHTMLGVQLVERRSVARR